MIRLVIFDFDGTLADTKAIILNSMHTVMELYGWRNASDEECAATIGLPLKEGFRMLFPECTDEELERRCLLHRQYFMGHCVNLTPPAFPGVPGTLASLKRMGIRMTMASSRTKCSLLQYLADMGMDGYFDLIVGPEDVANGKPSPDPVLKTLELTGCEADEALVVGDTSYDILMGVRAGVHTCGVSYGIGSVEQLQEAGAEHVIGDFSEILKMLQ